MSTTIQDSETITSVGTPQQLTGANKRKVLAIIFASRAATGPGDATGNFYIGTSTATGSVAVSKTTGFALRPGKELALDYRDSNDQGSTFLDTLYIDGDNATDRLDWIAITDG